MGLKTIIITGGGKGIGRAIALEFAKNGFHIITCGRSSEPLDTLKNELAEIGATCWVELCDIRNPIAIKSFIAAAMENNEGPIDVLVNNAGVYTPGQIHLEDEGVYEKMMETNVSGTYHFCRGVIPHMMDSSSAHIFNICSTASIEPYLNGGSYCISKYAQYGLTKVLREELKPKGIKVTAVLPGATLTDSWEGTDLPPDRFLQPETVARLIYNSYDLPKSGVVEDLLIRPMLGDIE
jgi:NADP-dependent 3-hydroxy acid dehydrogenase YdfG